MDEGEPVLAPPREQFNNINATDSELLYACQLTLEISKYDSLASVDIETPPAMAALPGLGWVIIGASHWEECNKIDKDKENDYQGVLLINNKKKLILLAHRGMQYTMANLAAVQKMATSQYPKIVDDALSMCDYALDKHNTDYKDYQMCHVGFSMGGFLAQVTATYCNHHHQNYNTAICFDSPGAGDIIQNKGYNNPNDNQRNVLTYLTSPNVVNTATPHFGYLRQIKRYEQTNSYLNNPDLHTACVRQPLELNITTNILSNAFSFAEVLLPTLNTHNQEFLRQDLEQSDFFDYLYIKQWPLASNLLFNEHPTVVKHHIPNPKIIYNDTPKIISKTQTHLNKSLETALLICSYIKLYEAQQQHKATQPYIDEFDGELTDSEEQEKTEPSGSHKVKII